MNPERQPQMMNAPEQGAQQVETYWGLVVGQFRKNRLAVGSAFFVLTLFLIAIGAPFLADSKPIVFQGAYRGQYQDRFEEWRRGGHPELLAQIEAMREAMREGADADGVAKLEAVTKLEAALSTVERQLLFLASQLADTEAEELTGYLDAYRAAATGAASAEAATQAAMVTFEMTERRIAERFAPERVQLERKLYWPVIRDLRPVDLFFLTLALMVMALGLMRTLAQSALPPAIRRSARNQFLVLVLPAVLAAVLWSGRMEVFDTQSYKEQILNGQIESSFALFPPVPYGINEDHLVDKFLPPGATYWMGTDGNGRDLMARMIWGARISLSVGFVAVGIYVTIGIFVGTLAGYFRGWVDMVFSRAIEIVVCFPAFFLILAVLAFLQPSMWNIMVVIGITGWTTEARLVRGEFLRLADQEFVMAARGLGVGSMRIIFRHILPNGVAPLLVSASFGVASAILIESSLSFLGFGISIPVPSWGGILNEARESFRYWWITIFPGLAIFSTVTAYNLIGEGIRDAIDPRLKV